MTAPRGIKIKEGENLTDSNIERVINLLNDKENPISKKEACDILNINYNTSRLSKIIEEYNTKLDYEKSRRTANRNKPASPLEIKDILESYLSGEVLSKIAERLFRTPLFVKKVLEEANVIFSDYSLIPEERLADNYKKGDYVYSLKYGEVALVESKEVKETSLGSGIYNLYLTESDKKCCQAADNLIDLRDLIVKYNLDIKPTKYDALKVRELIAEGILAAKTRGKKAKETDD